jgi:hypothetical protein
MKKTTRSLLQRIKGPTSRRLLSTSNDNVEPSGSGTSTDTSRPVESTSNKGTSSTQPKRDADSLRGLGEALSVGSFESATPAGSSTPQKEDATTILHGSGPTGDLTG